MLGTKALICIGFIAALACCGAAGEPLRPAASVGVSVGTNGVSTNANVSATQGPLTLSLGL